MPTAFKAYSQQGIALVYAIFVIIVIAGSIAVLTQWLNSSAVIAQNDIQRARALAAANAGIDWAVYRIQNALPCPASATLSLTDGVLSGYAVQVNCTATAPISEGAGTFVWYTVNSRAYTGALGQPEFVSREVAVSIAK